MTYKPDKRGKESRFEREFVEFPLKDADGVLVSCDRRVSIDRHSKILVTPEFITDAQFREYFETIE